MPDEKKFKIIDEITDVLESLKGIEGASHERIDAVEVMVASLSQLLTQHAGVINTMNKTSINLVTALEQLTKRIEKLEGAASLNYSLVGSATNKSNLS